MQSTHLSPLKVPNWKGLNTNAFMQILKKYPEHCTILDTIPQASVTYRIAVADNISGLETMQALQLLNGILKFCYMVEAHHMLFDEKPRWCAALSYAIPEAIFQPCPRPSTQNASKVIKIPWSFRKKLNDSAFTKNPRSVTTAPNLTALTNDNLRL